MTDSFVLSIIYKGEEKDYTGYLLLQGHSHKFKVMVGELEVFFELDEEGSYRAVLMPWQEEKDLKKIDRQLLSLLQQKIEEILR